MVSALFKNAVCYFLVHCQNMLQTLETTLIGLHLLTEENSFASSECKGIVLYALFS